MANTLAIVSFFIGLVITTSAGGLFCCILFPESTRSSRIRLETQFWRCMIAGLVVLAVSAALFGGFLLCRTLLIGWFSDGLNLLARKFAVNRVANDAIMLAHVIGWAMICPLLSTGLIGLAAVAEVFSSRMLARKQEPFSMRSIAYGAILPLLSCCIPFVGWYFVAPVLGLACLGSGFCGVFLSSPNDERVAEK